MIRWNAAIAVLLLIALLVGAATPAVAAEGLFMTWNDCALGASARADRSMPCDNNSGSQTLYSAFRMPFPIDSVLGVDIVIDLQQTDPSMPSWWEFAPDSCHAAGLQASFDFSVNTSCVDFWNNEEAGALQGYYLGQPRGGANQARIKIGAAVLPGFGYRQLDATSMYYAAKLTITNQHATGASACPGCLSPACLVLNSIAIRRQPGAPGGDVTLEIPGPGNANWATWQGGAGADCQAVPVRKWTWGRIKSLYR
jgi:hypothetical protein